MRSHFFLIRARYSQPKFNTFVNTSYFLNKRFYVAIAVANHDTTSNKTTYTYANSPMQKNKNLIDEAIEDHRVIKDLWERFKKEGNSNERQRIANTIIRELSVHSATEEIVLYPLIEKYFSDGKKAADHSREEHLRLKNDLYKLDSMKVSDKGYVQLFTKAMKEFEHHITEEEGDSFPKLKQAIGNDEQLKKLGTEFEKTRPKVPTRPHPSAPDKPPMETLAGMGLRIATAPHDKGRDILREFVKTIRDQI